MSNVSGLKMSRSAYAKPTLVKAAVLVQVTGAPVPPASGQGQIAV